MRAKVKCLIAIPLLIFAVAGGLAVFYEKIPPNWLKQSNRDAVFVLDQLRVEGAERTTREEILSALELEDGMPLMSIDLKKLRERMESLPWVRAATVGRRLPNELSIGLEERKPFALWQLNGVVSLIDASGIIITTRGLGEFSNHLLLVGEGAPKAAADLVYLLSMSPEIGERVRSAIRINERRWDLMFDNGIRVKLPAEEENYSPEVAWAQFVLQEEKHRLLDREVSVIDLRLQDRMVMRVLPEGHKNLKNKRKDKGV